MTDTIFTVGMLGVVAFLGGIGFVCDALNGGTAWKPKPKPKSKQNLTLQDKLDLQRDKFLEQRLNLFDYAVNQFPAGLVKVYSYIDTNLFFWDKKALKHATIKLPLYNIHIFIYEDVAGVHIALAHNSYSWALLGFEKPFISEDKNKIVTCLQVAARAGVAGVDTQSKKILQK